MEPGVTIVPFEDRHRREVIDLWRSVFAYTATRNDPASVIDKKVHVEDGLFFVAENAGGEAVGTVMCGYDGHRGWIYSLAVEPGSRRCGVGTALMERAEQVLADLGCVKINLQIVEGNDKVAGFYGKLGYAVEPRISMGKTISRNVSSIDGDSGNP